MSEAKKSKRDEHGGRKDWNKLLGYVKNQIMCLPKDSSIPKYMIYRLDGLSEGKYISNKNVEQQVTYQYKDMHEAFKIAKKELDKRKVISDSKERLDYALAIVENKINDVVHARKRKEKQIDAVKQLDLSVHTNDKAEYKPSPEIRLSPEMEELWY